nr:MAG: replication initiator protein [Microvirus sp.]
MVGLVPFQLPCGKCLACHLNRAREKGIRAWHESKFHSDSIFLTLTYSDEHLKSDKLIIADSQNFIKRLRKSLNHPIGVVTTGEYGTKTKRPHWHYLIFGYRPNDCVVRRTTDFGPTYDSGTIRKLWEDRGRIEIGAVTLESASYVARYGAKSLGECRPEYKPHHRTGSKSALGKSWIERYHRQTFERGYINLPNHSPSKIPRYYVDWAKKEVPELWRHYAVNIAPELQFKAEMRARKEELDFFSQLASYKGGKGLYPLNRRQVEHIILKQKFKNLAENWSL